MESAWQGCCVHWSQTGKELAQTQPTEAAADAQQDDELPVLPACGTEDGGKVRELLPPLHEAREEARWVLTAQGLSRCHGRCFLRLGPCGGLN